MQSEQTEINKAVCRRFLEAIFNDGDLSSIWDFVTADALIYELDALDRGAVLPGQSVEWLANLVFVYRRAFPDLHLEIESQIAQDDCVVTCLRLTGTHRRRLLGIEPSGRTVDVVGVRIDRLTDGKIAESFFHLDTPAILRPFGVLPDLRSAGREAARPRLAPPAWEPLPQAPLWAPTGATPEHPALVQAH